MQFQRKVAQVLSNVLDRKISHVRKPEADVAVDLQSQGLEPEYSRMLAALDTSVANGIEHRLNDEVLLVTGRPPKLFREFVEASREIWT
jgi:hypothetical protein